MSILLHLNNNILRVDRYTDHLIFVKERGELSLSQLGQRIFSAELDWCDDVISTPSEICLCINSRFQEIQLTEITTLPTTTSRQIQAYKLPVYFEEGEDSHAVMTQLQQHNKSLPLSNHTEFVSYILSLQSTVSMFGFMPGFIYLDGLPPSFSMPRKAIPAKRVSAGSLAIGGPYIGLYSYPSPGGWHIIGRSPIKVSIKEIQNHLTISDSISLIAIDKKTFQEMDSAGVTFHTYNFPDHA